MTTSGPDGPTPGEQLRRLEAGTSIEAALGYYDALPAVDVSEMLGAWRGSGLPTAHPFDGLLARYGWHGKRCDGADEVHPLVFGAPANGLVNVNPSLLPLGPAIRFSRTLRNPLLPRLFVAVRPLLGTTKPKARLRMMEYRGVVTATMRYDALPVDDAFRKVDDDTVVGAMDLRGTAQPFMFVLRRETR